MDEATWAILLCKETADEHVNSLQEYKDDNHNNLEQIQHFTDISNNFSTVEDGGGNYNNSNSSSSNLSVNNNNNNNSSSSNNNNNDNCNNNFNNTFNKEYHRLGSNGIPLRGSPFPENDEFIDLDNNYNHLSMMHYNSCDDHQNNHQHNNHNNHIHHTCNSTSVISSANQHQEEMSHHQYTNGDHNHYHLQNHHIHHRYDYSNAISVVPHYSPGAEKLSSNHSTLPLSPAQHNHSIINSQRHTGCSYSLRRASNVSQTSSVRGIHSNNNYPSYAVHHSSQSTYTDQESCSDSESKKCVMKEEAPTYPARRRPGRPRGSRRKKPEKLGRLWEFIRDLLLNPESCPSLICWDNYEEGMFRFVHSDKVAKLWGEKRDNPEMNYEKLSRAMRYYYKSNVLQPVFGRRLVYKFGPEARGWKTPNPNFTC